MIELSKGAVQLFFEENIEYFKIGYSKKDSYRDYKIYCEKNTYKPL